MQQLVFNDKFNVLVEEPSVYYTNLDEFYEHRKDALEIQKFIESISNYCYMENIYTDKQHCGTCLQEIDDHQYCSYCKKKCTVDFGTPFSQYEQNVYEDYYYIFDVVDGEALLYTIKETIHYSIPVAVYYMPSKKYTIDAVYSIKSDKMINLLNKKVYSYQDIAKWDEAMNYGDISLTEEEIDTYFELSEESFERYHLYTENLEDLKQTTVYKYTEIWKGKEYLKKSPTILRLVFIPVYFKQFEFLMRKGFYDLAFSLDGRCLSAKSFHELLPVDKKYYPFIKEMKMNFYEFSVYQTCPTFDKKLYDFMLYDPHISFILSEYIKLDKAKQYLDQYGNSYEMIYEYADYLRLAKQFGYDLKDKKYLFPQNLQEQYCNLYLEQLVANDHHIEKKLKGISSLLNLNNYETKDYIIFPASSVESLIDEGRMQHNCVRMYCKDMAENRSQIYFMRKKEEIEKSFVTIEVVDNRVVQAKTKYNREPNKDVKKIINEWSKTLLPIVNEIEIQEEVV